VESCKIDVKWQARRRLPPCLPGRSRQMRWNSTQRPFYRSAFHRLMLGPELLGRTALWHISRMARTSDRAQLRCRKKYGLYGFPHTKKSWSTLKYPSSFCPTSLDRILWLYRTPSPSWMARSL